MPDDAPADDDRPETPPPPSAADRFLDGLRRHAAAVAAAPDAELAYAVANATRYVEGHTAQHGPLDGDLLDRMQDDPDFRAMADRIDDFRQSALDATDAADAAAADAADVAALAAAPTTPNAPDDDLPGLGALVDLDPPLTLDLPPTALVDDDGTPLGPTRRTYHQGVVAWRGAHGRADLRDPDDETAAPFAHVVLTPAGTARPPTVNDHYAHHPHLVRPAPDATDDGAPDVPDADPDALPTTTPEGQA